MLRIYFTLGYQRALVYYFPSFFERMTTLLNTCFMAVAIHLGRGWNVRVIPSDTMKITLNNWRKSHDMTSSEFIGTVDMSLWHEQTNFQGIRANLGLYYQYRLTAIAQVEENDTHLCLRAICTPKNELSAGTKLITYLLNGTTLVVNYSALALVPRWYLAASYLRA